MTNTVSFSLLSVKAGLCQGRVASVSRFRRLDQPAIRRISKQENGPAYIVLDVRHRDWVSRDSFVFQRFPIKKIKKIILCVRRLNPERISSVVGILIVTRQYGRAV